MYVYNIPIWQLPLLREPCLKANSKVWRKCCGLLRDCHWNYRCFLQRTACGLGTHYDEKHRGLPTPAAALPSGTEKKTQKHKEYRTQKYTQVNNHSRHTCMHTNCITHTHTHTVIMSVILLCTDTPTIPVAKICVLKMLYMKQHTLKSLGASEVIGGSGLSLQTDMGSKPLCYSQVLRKRSCHYVPN